MKPQIPLFGAENKHRPKGSDREAACVLMLSASVFGTKVGAVLPFPSVLLQHLLGPEQQPEAGGIGSEPQHPGRLRN